MTQPAVRGQANSAVIRKVATWLGVPASSVWVAKGQRARMKTVEVRAMLGSLPLAELASGDLHNEQTFASMQTDVRRTRWPEDDASRQTPEERPKPR